MKTSLYISAFATLVACTGLFSCSDDVVGTHEGQGTVALSVKVSDNPTVVTRASEDDLAASAIVYIYNTQGLIRKYRGTSTIPAQLWFNSGSYKVVASAGDSVPASFTQKFFRGEQPFTISAGSNTTVVTTCKIQNAVVKVNFDSTVQHGLANYAIKVSNGGGELVFNADNFEDSKGYFMLNADEGETELNYEITGTQANGSPFSQKGVISDVKPTTLYTINISYSPNPQQYGGAFFNIKIEEEEIVEKTIEITAAPAFSLGSGYDIAEDVTASPGGFRNQLSVYVAAATSLTNVKVASALFRSKFGLTSDEFDVIYLANNPSSSFNQELTNCGISYSVEYDESQDNAIVKVSFKEALLNTLPDGTYFITFVATDAKQKQRTYEMKIKITDAKVETVEIVGDDVYTNRSTIYGKVLTDDATNIKFDYRKKGTTEWTTVNATVNGINAYAQLTGLAPATTYEYFIKADGFTTAEVKSFTTDEERQLPNSSFENWQLETPYLVYGAGEEMFWDTGNHGSKTMGVNVTVPSTTYKNSGQYSIDLKSQFVSFAGIGKFAAGNVFAGKYIRTDGTDGVLGFGRPWTTRPTQLTGYIKYNTGAIDKTGSGAPSGVAGTTDKGNIYVALMDDYLETDSNSGEKFPKIIRTKSSDRSLFDKESEHIIGFGEIMLEESTSGDGLVKFTINIDYRSNKKPSYLVLTASASYLGDYFTGCTTAEMWLDDLQFIY